METVTLDQVILAAEKAVENQEADDLHQEIDSAVVAFAGTVVLGETSYLVAITEQNVGLNGVDSFENKLVIAPENSFQEPKTAELTVDEDRFAFVGTGKHYILNIGGSGDNADERIFIPLSVAELPVRIAGVEQSGVRNLTRIAA